ncbi:MAG: tRNA pseudouridine(55) synthase TruB [Isosphaeraceae bacterium]
MSPEVNAKGVLNLIKPSGVTSRAVVDRVTRLLPRTKVGHAGTLDPLASGVLIVCLGAATRLVEHVQRMGKTYRAVIRLGARSDTLDADGQVEELDDPRIPAEIEIQQAVARQVGQILQRPPRFSALRIKGQRAYDLARSGREVTLAPRPVRIDRIEIVNYHWPHLELEIDCGGGTYIRSIARDLGAELGCGGLIETLVRTRIGNFRIEDGVDSSSLTRTTLAAYLHPLIAAVPDLPTLNLDAGQVAAVAQGRVLNADSLRLERVPEGEIALLDNAGQLAALARGDPSQNTIHPFKVFV